MELSRNMLKKISQYRFLFEELVKRDFKKKYKRTVLGMGWSLLSPLLNLLVMKLVFTQFFGRTTSHYTIYLFCGTLIFGYFAEATKNGMESLMENARIYTKINIPKYLFVFSKNVHSLISFFITFCVFLLFVAGDRLPFTPKFFMLILPVVSLIMLNIGIGLILSALNVFFRDIKYLYDIFITLLRYMSAIFYTVDKYPPQVQKIFLLNPVYVHIRYFRDVVINGTIPSLAFHGWMFLWSAVLFGLGCIMYKKNNTKFLYYI